MTRGWSDEARLESIRVRRLKALMKKRLELGAKRSALSPKRGVLPPAPGTAPIPKGCVRLYHQTSEHNAEAIGREGITFSKARGIEGPRAVYAGEEGFYFKPGEESPGRATVEFYVPKDKWLAPNIVLQDVLPENIIGIHLRWHEQVRYFEESGMIQEVLSGELDDFGEPEALAYIKAKYRDRRKKRAK